MVNYCIRQILMDRQTLDDYENNRLVVWKDIKRRLLLNERFVNPHIPDHFLRGAQDAFLLPNNIDNLSELLLDGTYSLSKRYIHPINNKLYIKRVVFFEWQELLTFCSPLFLIASYIYHNKKSINDLPDPIQFNNWANNIRYTALLSPHIAELEALRKREGGFNDLHIHLNGTTETDVVWQDALNHPNKLRKDYKNVFGNDLVIEQNEQEHIFKDPDQLYFLLEKARALRFYLVNNYLVDGNFQIIEEYEYPNTDTKVYECVKNLIRGEHPLKTKYRLKNISELKCECLLYIKLFQALEHNGNEKKAVIAKAFHHYLLILGAINRFIVQQIHQNGFQQFQKITQNDLRSFSEKKYNKRFFQLHGNNHLNSNFHTIEGRYAPKMNPQEIDSLIGIIRTGWYDFKTLQNNSTELRLITHFIKKKSSFDENFRHEKLRNKLWTQANAIISLVKDREWMQFPESDIENLFCKFVGIDAAASEFDAPPEVFAPTFRLLRNENIKNFTFHAGEDFFHVISGLRAIYETVEFLEFESGNRIGHATALGVSPQLWKGRIGEEIYVKRGEWLDNLIFVYELLKSNCCYQNKRNNIRNVIQGEMHGIYGDDFQYSVDELVMAWKCRKWNPVLILHESYAEAVQFQNFDEQEWKEIQNLNLTPSVKEIIRKYHEPSSRKNYNVMTLVDFELIDIALIKKIQSKLANILKKKNIIIETLPTSNVRIGIYKTHTEHHIKNWMKKSLFRKNMNIVVGSDDTGIFATNIYNEYANIYCNLIANKAMSHNEAMRVIEKLDQNSKTYKFL